MKITKVGKVASRVVSVLLALFIAYLLIKSLVFNLPICGIEWFLLIFLTLINTNITLEVNHRIKNREDEGREN